MVLYPDDRVTFNKAIFKSALLNVGDKVRIGKVYIRRGCPSLAVGDRVLIDNLGIRKSACGFKTNYYCGFGGGDDYLYTIWSGNNGISPLKWGWTIEKRQVPTLEIVKSVTLGALAGWTNYPIYYHTIGGSGQFLYHLKMDSLYNTEVRKYDSNSNYSLVSTVMLESFTPNSSPPIPWNAGVSLNFTIAENIITLFEWYFVGFGPYPFQPLGYPPSPYYGYAKWNADTGALIDHCEYNTPYSNGTLYPPASIGVGSGLEDVIYAEPTGNISTFAFPSDGTTYSSGDPIDNTGTGLYMTDDIGFSDIYPAAIGSDTCTGYVWDPATLTRTAL